MIIDNKVTTPFTTIQDLSRKPTPSEALTYTQLQALFDKDVEALRLKHNLLIDDIISTDGFNIKTSGVQTINGVKTFTESPIIPTPTLDMQPTNKKYVSDNFATKTENNLKANSSDVYTKSQIDTTQATKAELQSFVLGEIPNGALTDEKLSNDVGQIKERFTSSLADMSSQVSGKGASLIGLNDSGSKFTATNVEGALSELFTNASSGKVLVKNAITGKGGTVTDANSDGIYTHQELADGVNTISTAPIHGYQSYDVVGTYNFVVPVGVTKVSVIVLGGGGKGGNGYAGGAYGGSGGGAGGSNISGVDVTPSATIPVVVGGSSQDSSFNSSYIGNHGIDGYVGAVAGKPGGGGGNGNGTYGIRGDKGSTVLSSTSTGSNGGVGDLNGYGTGGTGGSGQNGVGANGTGGRVTIIW